MCSRVGPVRFNHSKSSRACDPSLGVFHFVESRDNTTGTASPSICIRDCDYGHASSVLVSMMTIGLEMPTIRSRLDYKYSYELDLGSLSIMIGVRSVLKLKPMASFGVLGPRNNGISSDRRWNNRLECRICIIHAPVTRFTFPCS